MKRYQDNPRCEKCDASGAHIKLKLTGKSWSIYKGEYDLEHLQCFCERCGYKYEMFCKDSETTELEGKE